MKCFLKIFTSSLLILTLLFYTRLTVLYSTRDGSRSVLVRFFGLVIADASPYIPVSYYTRFVRKHAIYNELEVAKLKLKDVNIFGFDLYERDARLLNVSDFFLNDILLQVDVEQGKEIVEQYHQLIAMPRGVRNGNNFVKQTFAELQRN